MFTPISARNSPTNNELIRYLLYQAVIGQLVILEYQPRERDALSTPAKDFEIVLATE